MAYIKCKTWIFLVNNPVAYCLNGGKKALVLFGRPTILPDCRVKLIVPALTNLLATSAVDGDGFLRSFMIRFYVATEGPVRLVLSCPLSRGFPGKSLQPLRLTQATLCNVSTTLGWQHPQPLVSKHHRGLSLLQ